MFRVPWMLIVVGCWVAASYGGLSMQMTGLTAGTVLFVMSVVALVMEFGKLLYPQTATNSGFMREQTISVVCVSVSTWLATSPDRSINVSDMLIAAVVFVEAILGPCATYIAARRDVVVGR